jgi:hypothetical protein
MQTFCITITIFSIIAAEEVEEKTSLEDLLKFLTGSRSIPPLGFDPKPRLQFNLAEDATKDFPVVSTCALTLDLPLVSDYSVFKTNFVNCIHHACFFSKA